jgi:hypothetical protein
MSAMLLWTLAAAPRDPRRCSAVPEHFLSGLRGRVELRLPPEGAIGAFSFRRPVLVTHRRGSSRARRRIGSRHAIVAGPFRDGNSDDLTTAAACDSAATGNDPDVRQRPRPIQDAGVFAVSAIAMVPPNPRVVAASDEAEEPVMTIQFAAKRPGRTLPKGRGKGPGVVWHALPAATKPCRVPGCGDRIDLSRLMCRHDWRLVPKPARDRVWATWEAGYGVLSREHRAAVRAAIQSCLASRKALSAGQAPESRRAA